LATHSDLRPATGSDPSRPPVPIQAGHRPRPPPPRASSPPGCRRAWASPSRRQQGGRKRIIGTEFVAKSAKDGHTLLCAVSNHATNPMLYKQVLYDPMRDFGPVSVIGYAQRLGPPRPWISASTELGSKRRQIRRRQRRAAWASSETSAVLWEAASMVSLISARDVSRRWLPITECDHLISARSVADLQELARASTLEKYEGLTACALVKSAKARLRSASGA
jgi:hypothetical protein